MGSKKADQLTTTEAKARLREAVSQFGIGALIKQRPVEALAVSFTVGLVLATSKPLRSAMMRMLVRII